MTRVKICGLRTAQDANYVNAYGADYAGVILAKGYGRTISLEEAQKIRKVLSSDIPLVGVYVDEDIETVIEAVRSGAIQIVQLHGRESDGYIRWLKEHTSALVWKVFRMKEEQDLEDIMSSKADCVLLDAGAGDGKTFDWSLTKGVKRPFLLAGGLDVQNVAKAIEIAKPFGVDVSSGVETDGRKDKDKIAAFIEAVERGE